MLPELEYELVLSRRAKRVTLRVVPGRGLVVSIPRLFPQSRVPEFVQRHRSWIDAALKEQVENTPLAYRQWPPRQLWLPVLGKSLQINCSSKVDVASAIDSCVGTDDGSAYTQSVSTHGKDLLVPPVAPELQLDVLANIQNRSAVAQEIAGHLKSLARDFLPPLLASYAHLHGLHYKRVSIRGQRTRWGSYSSTGTITLNYKLLFLSRDLVAYVVLHELAHTRYPDHSEAFWQLLSQLDVNARKLDRQLRTAGSAVPPWLELAR